MKEKSYQTKSIQSLGLNPEVALPLYVKLQPCCRPWRTCHSRKCFSRSKRKSTGLKTGYGPQHVELFHSFWGAFLETCHCLIYVRNTYCVWSPDMHMCYPCVGFNIVFRSFLSQGLYVLEKHGGKALFLLSELLFQKRRVKRCVIWVPWEADAKMGLNMLGFNRGNFCDRPHVGSWCGWECPRETDSKQRGGKKCGWMHPRWPCRLQKFIRVARESRSESQLSEESWVTQEQACLGITAVYSHGLGPAWRQCDLGANRSWISDHSSWSQFCSLQLEVSETHSHGCPRRNKHQLLQDLLQRTQAAGEGREAGCGK